MAEPTAPAQHAHHAHHAQHAQHAHHAHDGQHQAAIIERHCDVAVIGGSAAGFAAALQLGRQRRSVIVVDGGEPRNAPASHLHSYLGHEGLPPAQLSAIGREEVRSYGVEVLAAQAVAVTRAGEQFGVELVGGHRLVARRVLAATGLVDELPDIEGLHQHWGTGVIHCPFCHGYEARDRRIVQIITHPSALHPAALYRQLTDRLTLVLHAGVEATHPDLERSRAAGVAVLDEPVRRILTAEDGTGSGSGSGPITGIETVHGTHLDADVVAISPRFTVRAELLVPLGVVPVAHPSGLGDVVETDPTGATSVAGLYAAGNVTDPAQQLLQAAAQGSWVGAMISFDLAREDLASAGRSSANEADWDHRYHGAALWSGNPNGALVHELRGVAPGRALDVGAGEGGDAVWLAQQGWRVTASDISQRALDRVAAVADARGLAIDCLHADANALRPYPAAAYDVVSAHYASIPRTPDGRAVANLLDAVAPGGLLLVVGHDLEPMRVPIDTARHSRPFDPDGYVRVEDVVRALTEAPGWNIERHEKRPRPAGAASSHHVDDIVLRARRSGR